MTPRRGPRERIRLPAFDGDRLNVIIETPKGSRAKYAYDPVAGLLELKFTLPAGHAFPYDFGFIPSTRAEDGDPLDVLVLLDEPALAGCRVRARLVGVLRAWQRSEGKPRTRNDRLLAVQDKSESWAHVATTSDLPRQLRREVESFFVEYNRLRGKRFKPLGWKGPRRALSLVRAAIT